MSAVSQEVTYRIDEKAQLVWINQRWQAFARENGAADLADPLLVGESLWRFVEGIEIRHLYELIFDKVRRERCAIVLPFRCDSPDRRRFMRLRVSVSAQSQNELELAASLINEELRDAVQILDPEAPRRRSMLVICSFCKRLEVAAAGWLEVEDAASQLDLLSNSRLPKLSHGVCPECRDRAHDLLARRH